MSMAIIALLPIFKVTWRQNFLGELHVDHKPLNIKTTHRNRLRSVNARVLFIQKNRRSTVLAFVSRPAAPFTRWRRRNSRGNRRGGFYVYMSMSTSVSPHRLID